MVSLSPVFDTNAFAHPCSRECWASLGQVGPCSGVWFTDDKTNQQHEEEQDVAEEVGEERGEG